jgi:mannose-1-phosphate guanylyltransferase/mannose-6-phosphate isomerase
MEPKQFLPLLGGQSPFQRTLQRISALPGVQRPWIITNQEHQAIASAQARAVGCHDHGLLLEPFGRGTAPAIAVAAHHLLANDQQASMLVLPADHDIPDAEAFWHDVLQGLAAVDTGRLVVFGLNPGRAETGFGYIERGAPLGATTPCFDVKQFVEKPELEIAQRFVNSGRHYWNSGIFLFGAAHFLAELEHLEPELAEAAVVVAASLAGSADCRRIDAELFSRCRTASVDHAVLERTHDAAMVAATFPWSDIGSWQALWEGAEKDSLGNIGHGDIHLHSVADCYVHASHRMVVAIGIKDLVIIETGDALLVAARDESQRVKEVVEELRAQDREEANVPRCVRRPWGHYEDVDSGERFRVKRITVNPGAKLSLQLHHHRAEHWVVVKGTARITRGEEIVMLYENQSTYIPIGVSHRLENPGKIPLEVIETQSGAYLKEDDIVRLQDSYDRV